MAAISCVQFSHAQTRHDSFNSHVAFSPIHYLIQLWKDYYNLANASKDSNPHYYEIKENIGQRITWFMNKFDNIELEERFYINIQVWMKLYLYGDSIRAPSRKLKLEEPSETIYRSNHCERPIFPDYTDDLFAVIALVDQKKVSMKHVYQNFHRVHYMFSDTVHNSHNFITLILYTYYIRLYKPKNAICTRYAFGGYCNEICGCQHICLYCEILRSPKKRCCYKSEKYRELESVIGEKIQKFYQELCVDGVPIIKPKHITMEMLKEHDLLINIREWLNEWELDPRNKPYVFSSDGICEYLILKRCTRAIGYSLSINKTYPGLMQPFEITNTVSSGDKVILKSRNFLQKPSSNIWLRCPTKFHFDNFMKRIQERPKFLNRYEHSISLSDAECLEKDYIVDGWDVTVLFHSHPDCTKGLNLLIDTVKKLPAYQQYIQKQNRK